MDEGVGVREEGGKLSVKDEGRGGGSELGSDLDLDPDPEPWKILWIGMGIQIRQNDADPLDLVGGSYSGLNQGWWDKHFLVGSELFNSRGRAKFCPDHAGAGISVCVCTLYTVQYTLYSVQYIFNK